MSDIDRCFSYYSMAIVIVLILKLLKVKEKAEKTGA